MAHQDVKKPLETDGRFHVQWLSMMWPRLKLARDMLTEDGFLFMSIGDRELDNSMRMLKEIFGEENFVKLFLWKKKRKPGYLSPKVGISKSKSGQHVRIRSMCG